MKMIGLVGIFLCCLLGGLWRDEDQRKRLKELREVIYLFEWLRAEIDYQLTPLKDACLQIGQREGRAMGSIFLEFSRRLEAKESADIQAMWQQALVSCKHKLHLLDKDYELLIGFGAACGYLDKNMQKRNLEMMIEQIEHERKRSEERYERCSKLNKALGALIGVALVIFLF